MRPGLHDAAVVRPRAGLKRRAVSEHLVAYTLLAPALVLLAIWFVYPIGSAIVLSFQQTNLFSYADRRFVGWSNYAHLFADPTFRGTLRITLTFVLFVVPAQTVLALVLAAALQSLQVLRSFFRTAFFVPYVTSTVAVTTVFMQLFVVQGPVTSLLSHLGLPNVTWYASVQLALPFLAIVYVWMNIGLYTVIFLGGLQTVPAELYEAATVDGAHAVARFLFITIPSLRPFMFFVIVSGMIQAFQVFDQAYVVSSGTILGGPAGATSTLVIFIFAQAFQYNNMGYACAAAVILLVIVFATTVAVRRLFPSEAYAAVS